MLLSKSIRAVLALATLLATVVAAEPLEGAIFQPTGENLMISPPAGWRLAYMNGTPAGDYVVEFMPANEAHDSWREGYMSVQRRSFPEAGLMANIQARNLTVAQVAINEVMQGVQRACPGRFVAMRQKDSITNGVPTSVSGGFCDRAGSAAPDGEGAVEV